MGHIQRHHLSEAMTIVPDQRTIKVADDVIAPLFNLLIANDLESRTLAATRDLLLPKLMSGEIRVTEAEKIVGDAT
jgi:type I restriction enzyme S subunit